MIKNYLAKSDGTLLLDHLNNTAEIAEIYVDIVYPILNEITMHNKKIPVYDMGYEKDSKDYILIYIDNMEYPNIFKSRVYNGVYTGISLCIY
jgi:hypothetical protein